MVNSSVSAPLPSSRKTGLVKATVARTVSPSFSSPPGEMPSAEVRATERTAGRSLSMVTVWTLLQASLPATSVTRARKLYWPSARPACEVGVGVQVEPPSVEISWTTCAPASGLARSSVKVPSLLMPSPAVPVSRKPTRLSVPGTGSVVSTL